MFAKEKEVSNARKIDTIIGKECSLKGNIDAPGGAVRIDGNFEGELHIGGDLIVGESGNVVGTIVAKNIIVAGQVKGNIESRGKLEVTATGRIMADVKMTYLVVEDGAFLQGQCSPLPRGDLKERGKSLQADTPEV